MATLKVRLRHNSRNFVAVGERIQREIRGGMRIDCDRIRQLCAKKWDPYRIDKIATKCKCRSSKELDVMWAVPKRKWAATELGEEKGRMQKAESRRQHPLTPALSPKEREKRRTLAEPVAHYSLRPNPLAKTNPK